MIPRSLHFVVLVSMVCAALVPALVPAQGLAGKRVVLSPGHGYYWHSTYGWTTQRPLIDGLIEDIHNSEILREHLLEYLEGAGAQVIMCRARSATTEEHVLDNDQGFPAYQETGPWITSTSSGWAGGSYRYAFAGPGGGSRAIFTTTINSADLFPVYVAYRAGTNRISDAVVEIHHAAGLSTRTLNQQIDDRRWVYVGTFPFRAGEQAQVILDSTSTQNGVIIADAVKIGDGMGSIVRGGTTSGHPCWKECSRYHAQYFGAPSSVWNPISGGEDNSDDVTCRPRYAEWWGADLYLSHHTNAGGGTGTSSFIYNGGATPGSATFQNVIHSRLITDIQTYWDPTWTDRGQHQANFGEVRELQTMPGCLIELAFHDDIGGDIEALHHPNFRHIAARAMYRAINDFLVPGTPWVPEPPKAVAMRNDGLGNLVTSWQAVSGATSYRVRLSDDGFAFDDGQVVTGNSLVVSGRPHDSLLYAQIAGINAGGRGPWSEPVGARLAPGGLAPLLLVNGFDRRDRSLKEHHNPRHWLVPGGAEIAAVAAAGYPFDGCSNEAIATLLVPLGDYPCIGWILGEESTQDESFSGLEQVFLTSYLIGGGRLFFSGAEVGWDLDQQGSASDRNFYEQTLGQDYVADDAVTYFTQATSIGPLAPLPVMQFSNGSNGLYDVDYPDVVQPKAGTGGQIVLRYLSGTGAAVLHGNGKVLGLGFPLEMIVDPAHRNLLMERILRLMVPMPFQPTGPVVAGQNLNLAISFPGRSGFTYLAAASATSSPGFPLPGGLVFPATPDPLMDFSLSPTQAIFQNMVGSLDVAGQGTVQVAIPIVPQLSGFSFVMSALAVDPAALTVAETAPWWRITLP